MVQGEPGACCPNFCQAPLTNDRVDHAAQFPDALSLTIGELTFVPLITEGDVDEARVAGHHGTAKRFTNVKRVGLGVRRHMVNVYDHPTGDQATDKGLAQVSETLHVAPPSAICITEGLSVLSLDFICADRPQRIASGDWAPSSGSDKSILESRAAEAVVAEVDWEDVADP